MTIARMPKFPVALAPNVSITEYVNPSADEYYRPAKAQFGPGRPAERRYESRAGRIGHEHYVDHGVHFEPVWPVPKIDLGGAGLCPTQPAIAALCIDGMVVARSNDRRLGDQTPRRCDKRRPRAGQLDPIQGATQHQTRAEKEETICVHLFFCDIVCRTIAVYGKTWILRIGHHGLSHGPQLTARRT